MVNEIYIKQIVKYLILCCILEYSICAIALFSFLIELETLVLYIKDYEPTHKSSSDSPTVRGIVLKGSCLYSMLKTYSMRGHYCNYIDSLKAPYLPRTDVRC